MLFTDSSNITDISSDVLKIIYDNNDIVLFQITKK